MDTSSGIITVDNLFSKTGFERAKVFVNSVEIEYCSSFNVDEGWAEYFNFDDNGNFVLNSGCFEVSKTYGVVTYEEVE